LLRLCFGRPGDEVEVEIDGCGGIVVWYKMEMKKMEE
jgi:hypothetical protein